MNPQEALDYLRERLPEITATPTDARPRWSARDVEALAQVIRLRIVPDSPPATTYPGGLSKNMAAAILNIAANPGCWIDGRTSHALVDRGLVTSVGYGRYMLTVRGMDAARLIQERTA